jgi:hypothetical protein
MVPTETILGRSAWEGMRTAVEVVTSRVYRKHPALRRWGVVFHVT